FQARLFQQQVQLIGFLSEGAGRRTRFAPGLTRLIISANVSESGDPEHYQGPVERKVSSAVYENHGRLAGLTLTLTLNMELVSAEVDQSAGSFDVAEHSFCLWPDCTRNGSQGNERHE